MANNPATWTGAPWADAPLFTWVTYRGDLQLDRSQNVNTLDLTSLLEDGGGLLRVGDELTEGDLTVRVPELRRWVGLQFSHRPTAGMLLVGAGLVLLGLIPALYAFRRRLWIEADPDPATGRTMVTVAGRTFQRPQAFEDEFARLRDEVAQALAAPSRSPSGPGPSGGSADDGDTTGTEPEPTAPTRNPA